MDSAFLNVREEVLEQWPDKGCEPGNYPAHFFHISVASCAGETKPLMHDRMKNEYAG
jgi:hypothetical protein